ncbi:MAG: IclR family transcriptional regulator [Myxococcota bacterium]|nr:IclR family transcriptional regulator [Myxococcota bacterium]
MEPPLATVDKAIDVLFALHAAEVSLGVTALSRALCLPKSSAHRLLAALRRRGLVEQDERGRYRLGIGLIALGLGVLEREPAVAAARPIIEQEAESLGETFFLVAARGGQLVVLDKAEGTGFLRAAPRVGAVVPVHATAVGKLQLALAPSELEFAIAPSEAFTGATHTSETAIRREVELARERGWAANVDEWIAGLSVLAAPVVHRGRLLAHVALAVPSARASELGLGALAERVCKTAERIVQRLAGDMP